MEGDTPKADEAHWRGRIVLVVSPTPTHPQDYGNRKRVYQICKVLQDAGARIHFVHYAWEGEWIGRVAQQHQQIMARQWDGYYLVPPTIQPHARAKGEHHDADEWWDPHLETTVRWLGSALRPDVLFVNYTWLSKACDCVSDETFKILDTNDKFAGRKEMLAQFGIPPEYFYTTEEQESRALARADLIWAIKDEETYDFSMMTRVPVITVPHADPANPLPRRKLPKDRADYELRLGLMAAKNSINVTNTRRFLDAVAPIWRAYLPPLKLIITGTLCEFLDDVDLPFVEKRGWIKDAETFYREVDAVVVPMEFSTGQKIKTAEAIGFGKPILSHAHAFEGYEPFHDYHVLPSFEAMAEACVDLAFAGPEALTELEEASHAAHRAVVKRQDVGLSQAGDALARHKTPFLMCLNTAAFSHGSISQLTTISTIQFFKHNGPLAVYIDQFDKFEDVLRFCKPLDLKRIFVSDACKRDLSDDDISEGENIGVQWICFDDVLRRTRVQHLWVDRVPRHTSTVAPSDFERISINLAQLADCPSQSDVSGFLKATASQLTTLHIVSPKDTPEASRLRAEFNATSIISTPFWIYNFPLLQSIAPVALDYRVGFTAILPTSSPSLERLLKQAVTAANQASINFIFLDRTDAEVRAHYEVELEVRSLSPNALTKTTLSNLRRAHFVVNFAPFSGFADVLETLFETAGHRIIRPFDDGPKAISGSYGLMQLISTMHQVMTDPELLPPVDTDIYARASNNPGWRQFLSKK
ncbi:MAG: glycosyltransferase family 4 protein [Pseudomonadota bacterium]